MVIKLLLISLLLVGCGDLPDEGTLKRQGTSVTITYNHPPIHDIELTRYNKSTRKLIENTWPVRHNIKVEPDIADIDLDENLRAEVEVPVDKPMVVHYTNWTQEEPEIHFQYGESEEFVVTWEHDYIVKVWVDVDINPDYPFPEEETTDEEELEEEETEEETTDNETVEEEIDPTLLVHYKFEGDLKDSSSYGRDLELCSGSSQFIFVDETIMNVLPSNKAAYFQGTECAENEFRDNSTGSTTWNQTSPLSTTDDWTISFWILPWISNTAFDQWHSVMSTGDNTNNQKFQIDHDGNEKLRGPYTVLKVDMEEEWMFFTYTKTTDNSTGDNQKVRVYKNADLKTYSYPVSTLWDKLKIGMNRNGGGGWYGLIDDFKIYNRALSATEIEELYESYD